MSPRAKWRWITGIGLAALAAVVGLWLFMQNQPGALGDLRISRETTFYTEPLREDGTVDYAAVLHKKYSEVVPSDNNAAIPLIRVIAPKEPVKHSGWPDVLEHFNISPNRGPAEERFIPLKEYVLANAPKNRLVPEDASSWTPNRTVAEAEAETASELARERPWSEEEFPMLAGWLEANEGPLAMIEEAVARPRLYFPPLYHSEDTSFIAAWRPHLGETRWVADALAIRARQSLDAGHISTANQDSLTINRLGRLVAQGPMIIDRLVGGSHIALAAQTDMLIAEHAEISPERFLRMVEQRNTLPPLPPMFHYVDDDFRLGALGRVQAAYRAGDTDNLFLPISGLSEDYRDQPWSPNDLLEQINEISDRVRAAAKMPKLPDQINALSEISRKHEENLEDIKERFDSWYVKATYFLTSARAKANFTNEAAAHNSTRPESFTRSVVVDGRTRVYHDLAITALALAAYRAEHGEYPEDLTALVPEYLSEVPQDAFAGEPLKYRREGAGYLLYSIGSNMIDDGGVDDIEQGDQVLRVPQKP